ncbi:MAG: cupin domain-containing protein [Candidatus Omnitrophica bacterium]|nr:cupin domain-containing protein [Candidatus Omnitrophota bacterium]
MKLRKKIMALLEQKGYKKIATLHRELINLFDANAIPYRNLVRALQGETPFKEMLLFQLGAVLGMSISDLRAETEEELSAQNKTLGIYHYNNKAYLEKLNDKIPFLPTRIVIKPGGRTSQEQDPKNHAINLKWIYVIKGTVELVLEGGIQVERKILKSEESYGFDCTLLHHFENNSPKQTAKLLVVHYPKPA